MQFKIFTIPVIDTGRIQDEMNKFIQNNKVVEIKKKLIGSDLSAAWCFCINYIDGSAKGNGYNSYNKTKVDYKDLLTEDEFRKFSKLREIRKSISVEQAIPAFAIFTDEELAGLAKLNKIDRKSMLGVKGIGDKKVEKYGEKFINIVFDG